ncbi:hypothetical protein FACS189449_10330 [Alphaproteobacteria bacterium]|nr:hypothetical protein FACS189449_10330 [Alphaproteobacteria bacterium]
MTSALSGRIISLGQQLQMLADFLKISDDKFVEVWTKLARLALSVAAFSENSRTPLDTFLTTGLLRLAARRDIEIQKRLFNSLPNTVKQPSGAPGITDPALDAEYLIPNPEVTDRSLNR